MGRVSVSLRVGVVVHVFVWRCVILCVSDTGLVAVSTRSSLSVKVRVVVMVGTPVREAVLSVKDSVSVLLRVGPGPVGVPVGPLLEVFVMSIVRVIACRVGVGLAVGVAVSVGCLLCVAVGSVDRVACTCDPENVSEPLCVALGVRVRGI